MMIAINNIKLGEFGEFEAERLWRVLAEEAVEINELDKNSLIDFQYLDDSDIESLLSEAQEKGFIESYEIEDQEEIKNENQENHQWKII